jgi:hypothetical protein
MALSLSVNVRYHNFRTSPFVGFGSLRPALTIPLVICSVLFLLLRGQALLAGFYFGLMNLVAERRTRRVSSSPAAVESEPIYDSIQGSR